MAKTGSIHTVLSAIPVPSVNAKKAPFLRGIRAVIVMAGRKKFPRKAALKFEVLKGDGKIRREVFEKWANFTVIAV